MQYYTMYLSNNEIIGDLSKALTGEYNAIHCYEILANQAPNSEVKKRILEIRSDEMRHYQMFAGIYSSITGAQPSPELTEKCPNNFTDGVLAAFISEQETVDFYHQIARKYNIPMIRETFMQAAEDEQNHAVWFLYFMNHQ